MAKIDRAEWRLDQAATDLQEARLKLNRLIEAPAPLLDHGMAPDDVERAKRLSPTRKVTPFLSGDDR
jgi:hypothetical protein